jgi:hypothetical protein
MSGIRKSVVKQWLLTVGSLRLEGVAWFMGVPSNAKPLDLVMV